MNDRPFEEWEKALRSNCNPSVQFVVLMIPGQKGKPNHYDKLKQLLLREMPIPS
jgi:hypothetical protein